MYFFPSFFYSCYVNYDHGVSVPHQPVDHVHETHGHKNTTSSEHGEEREEEEKDRKAEMTGIGIGEAMLS